MTSYRIDRYIFINDLFQERRFIMYEFLVFSSFLELVLLSNHVECIKKQNWTQILLAYICDCRCSKSRTLYAAVDQTTTLVFLISLQSWWSNNVWVVVDFTKRSSNTLLCFVRFSATQIFCRIFCQVGMMLKTKFFHANFLNICQLVQICKMCDKNKHAFFTKIKWILTLLGTELKL